MFSHLCQNVTRAQLACFVFRRQRLVEKSMSCRTGLLKYWSARAFAVDRGKLICLDTLIRSRTRKIITNINTNLSETITILRLFGAYGAMLICNLNYFN